MADVVPLPERTRLFHVGIPKSGTTALQMAASAGRETLLRNGVLYPGTKLNQRDGVLAFMERRWGWTPEGIPPKKAWHRLMDEIEHDTKNRVWFGHEFAAEADVETARRFVDAIGDRCHIAITLRSPGTTLPSAWQQYVKAGVPIAFDEWLSAVIADPPNRNVTKGFHDRNDQAGVVRRWADAAGADRVTVIILDKQRPELLFNAFESLLALPTGTLEAQELGGFGANRGLTVPEAEIFLALNALIRPKDVQWKDFQRLVRNGAIRRIMEGRQADEERPQLPSWAVKRAAELGAGYAKAIADSGVNVVGDLDTLAEEVPPRLHDDPPPTLIPVELAAEALAGMLSAATDRGAFFDTEAERDARIGQLARRLTVRDLARLTRRFVAVRFRRVLTRLRLRRS